MMSGQIEESLEFLELYDINKNLEKSTILSTSTNETARFSYGIDILKMKPNIMPAQWYINYSESFDEESDKMEKDFDDKQVTFDGLLSRMNRLKRELSEAEATFVEETRDDGQSYIELSRHNKIHDQSSSERQIVDEPIILPQTSSESFESTVFESLDEDGEDETDDVVNEIDMQKVRVHQRFSNDNEDAEQKEALNYIAKAKARTSISVDGFSQVDKHHLRRNGLNLINDSDALGLLQQKGKQLKKSNALRSAQSLESLKTEKQKGGFISRIRYRKSPRNMELSEDDEEGNMGMSMRKESAEMISRTVGMYVDEKGDLIRTVEIHRQPNQRLGFFIRFGNGLDRDDGIFVSRVTLGSIVDENNLLLSGDEIIKVNGTNVVNSTLEDVVALMQDAELLNIETRSQTALQFNTPYSKSADHPRTYSAPQPSCHKYLHPATKLRSRTVQLDEVMEDEELVTNARTDLKGRRNEDDGSSSDSDELSKSQEIETVHYPSDSTSTNLDYYKSFTGKLVVEISSICGLYATETNPCYCSIDINKEFKARTQAQHPSSLMTFDDKFDLDIQQAKLLSVKLYHEHAIFSDKCTASGYIVIEKLLGHEKQKHCLLISTKGNVQIRLNIKFTEARSYLMRRQSTRATGVFGFNLSQTLVTEKNSIPILVRKCVAEIEERGLNQEGIYRISGNARKKKELRKQFEENSIATDISDPCIDCHVITGILKDYLRELPKPLISLDMYKKIHERQQVNSDSAAQRKMLSSIMKMAPPVNRATLIFIIEHLRRVTENIENNKMSYKNLAVCFGPVMMSPPIEEMRDFQKYIDALEFLLTIWPSETKQNMV